MLQLRWNQSSYSTTFTQEREDSLCLTFWHLAMFVQEMITLPSRYSPSSTYKSFYLLDSDISTQFNSFLLLGQSWPGGYTVITNTVCLPLA